MIDNGKGWIDLPFSLILRDKVCSLSDEKNEILVCISNDEIPKDRTVNQDLDYEFLNVLKTQPLIGGIPL
ncbi:hypothetical protein, partial [Rhodohalobacter sp.]|uniref:hypothetical protein n=1 Tax=Rhodohalobacter sp. TaxID=1974210 RepID=UPI003561EB73